APECRHAGAAVGHETLLVGRVREFACRRAAAELRSDTALAAPAVAARAVVGVERGAIGCGRARAARCDARGRTRRRWPLRRDGRRLLHEEHRDEHDETDERQDLDGGDEALEHRRYTPGNATFWKNHSELVAHTTTSTPNSSEPAVGNSHPGRRRTRTLSTFTTNSPKNAQPAIEWTKRRVSSSWPTKPSDHRQWNATGNVNANANEPARRWKSPSHFGIRRGMCTFP